MSRKDASRRPNRTAFGWHWLARALALRRGKAIRLILAIAAGYGAGLVFPIATQRIVDAVVAGRVDLYLFGLGVLAVLSIGLEVALFSLRQILIIDLAVFLDRRISHRVFIHLMRVRIDETAFQSGQVLNHFQQITKIRDFILFQLPNTVIDAGGALVSLGLVLAYDPIVGFALLAALPALILVSGNRMMGIRSTARAFYDALSVRDGTLAETVTGLATVKALALEGPRFRRWSSVTDGALKELHTLMNRQRRFSERTQPFSRAMTLLVIGVGCWRIYGGHLTVGEFFAIQVVSARITAPLMSSADILRMTQEVSVALRQIGGFLDLPRERAARIPPLRHISPGGIRFIDVSLTYPNAARPALQSVSITLPERGIVAIVGRNGSGKSTLLRILLGLQRGYTGRVEVGGADLRDYDPRWLRGRIGTVDQDTVLFSGNVRDNLAAGHSDPDALDAALRFAGVRDLVDSLPDGLATDLGEGGRTLSGGQRQRLSVARAVVRDPPIALLDEPTAFLDPEAALALERNLIAWGRNRLLILVTHHLAAARQADRILVLDAGRLVGAGAHEELLRTVPVYAKLWADYDRSRSQDAVTA
ncbi:MULTISPECIES: peptidase domain-containing ABC transporter [unclassified Methylobacterium]|jgi:ABC-type bacteriocin/lantibiotic exporter with double-glycine peptidase domain|uniref:peptidase domain-containing ABC transporter n=1 Tax=unclassified Methylobacterium TaxID=2615210 RepID=UPI001355F55D|nr:ATP-binding cassette domain-containing protein [Methylobacterium sp. 2A]MWV23599.1 ATP-binding cassette domain-containing protein [Methylobacterium sp. 2A]